MSKISRRHFLGFGAGAAGLAACATPSGSNTQLTDSRAPYNGAVSFDHGVASGDPLSDRVIVWSRVTPADEDTQSPIPVTVRICTDPSMSILAAEAQLDTSAARDFTLKADMEGLKPDTEYFYQFTAHTTAGDVTSPVARTRTAAASGKPPVKFAVVSCSNFPFGYFNVYDAISQRGDLDAVIHLGDYIYEYGVDGYGGQTGQEIGRNHEPPMEIVTLGDYRMRHAQYKADPMLQAAHAVAPWFPDGWRA